MDHLKVVIYLAMDLPRLVAASTTMDQRALHSYFRYFHSLPLALLRFEAKHHSTELLIDCVKANPQRLILLKISMLHRPKCLVVVKQYATMDRRSAKIILKKMKNNSGRLN